VQGVGEIYTDPQIVSREGNQYGAGLRIGPARIFFWG
jgi:hypothetical protein